MAFVSEASVSRRIFSSLRRVLGRHAESFDLVAQMDTSVADGR